MLEQKLQELSEVVQEFKKNNDARLKAVETKTATAEYEAKASEMNDKITQLENEIKKMQTAANRTGGQSGDQAQEQKGQKYAQEFKQYLRRGQIGDEMKAMSVASDPDGGYTVEPVLSSEIVKSIFDSSPIRQLASVQTISTNVLEMLEDLGEGSAGWVGESDARPETNTPQLGKLTFNVHEIYAMPKATQQLLDDSAFNIEAWLAEKVADKMARMENSAFVSGDGAGKPKGLLSYAAGNGAGQVEQTETAAAGTISGDDLIALMYELQAGYEQGAGFLAKRSTVKHLRTLKDSTGQYLWTPGLNGAAQASILAKPLVEAEDMPAMAAGNLAMIYGNLKAAYQIIDRIGIRVLRDPYTAKPHVLFYATKRVGGGVKNFKAYKILKVKA